nr:hypothetical protein [Tanacetum cinerariifolium]
MPFTSVEEKAQRRLEVTARSTLMMCIPNEHQLKFNSIKDAKHLLEAIEKRFVKTAQAVNTANGVSTKVNATNIDNLSDVVIYAFLIADNCKKRLGYESYNAVPPPYTRNFMPPKPDLSFTDLDEFFNKSKVVEDCEAKPSEETPKEVRKNTDVPVIED